MRSIIIALLACLSFNLYSQSFGVGLGIGTVGAWSVSALYKGENGKIFVGVTKEFDETKGEYVTEQLSNYGRTIDSRGTYFWTVDIGGGGNITEELLWEAELSIGSINDYTNFIDNRFTGGGYHMVTKREITMGIGGNIEYLFDDTYGLFIGYNTKRKLTFGARIYMKYY